MHTIRLNPGDIQDRVQVDCVIAACKERGIPIHVGDVVNDFALLGKARQDAFAVVAADPKLEHPEHGRVIPALRRMFAGKLPFIDAG